VPQKRKRVLIIGVRDDLLGSFPDKLSPAESAKPGTVLWDAIGDLPSLAAGDCIHNRSYDPAKRQRFLESRGPIARHYQSRVLEVNRAKFLANHVARPHSERDLRDFARLKEGENSAVAMRDRGVKFEFPYKKHHFKDRYTKQHRERACSTIVAHLSKDGLMFIHPTQQRSLTPREAARIQSFPDWFVFPEAKTHAFRLIGNAVPPLVGEAVGQAVMRLPPFKRNNPGISKRALEIIK
jgi:DNA (cytosine-5)-methyltransferase 1